MFPELLETFMHPTPTVLVAQIKGIMPKRKLQALDYINHTLGIALTQ